MENLRTQLKKQIAESTEFENANFGLKVGDSFKEMCLDILRSDRISALLLSQINIIGMSVPKIQMSMNKYQGEPAKLQEVILNNLQAFEIPLAMFFWGINIGKAIAAEEASLLQKLTNGVDLTEDIYTQTDEKYKEVDEKYKQFPE